MILSGYDCPLYRELYGDWNSVELPVTVHSSNAKAPGRGARVEVLWSNRALADGRLALGGST